MCVFKDRPGTNCFGPWGAVSCLLKTTPGNRLTVQQPLLIDQDRRVEADKVFCDTLKKHNCLHEGICIHVFNCSHAAWGSVAGMVCIHVCCRSRFLSVHLSHLTSHSSYIFLSVLEGMGRSCQPRPFWIKPPTNVKVSCVILIFYYFFKLELTLRFCCGFWMFC